MFFHTPSAFDTPSWGPHRNIAIRLVRKNHNGVATQRWRKFEDMVTRFNTTYERDRQHRPHFCIASFFFFFFQSVLCWSVAVSTICRQSSRVVAFLQAVARPKFRGPRSASIARSQVWLGLPAGRFQSGGTCQIHAARARWWSSRGELRAIWPNSCRRLLVTR